MSNTLKLEAILALTDKALAPLNAITKGSTKTAKALKQAKDTLKDLNDTQKKIDGFRQMQRDVSKNNTALAEATRKVAQLSQEIEQSTNPTRTMTRDYNRAIKAAGKLKQEHQALIAKQQQLRTTLNASGLSTTKLASHQRKLKQDMHKATSEVEQQTRALQQQSKAARALNSAKWAKNNGMQRRNEIAGAGASVGAAGVGMALPVIAVAKEFAVAESAATNFKVAMMDKDGKVNAVFEQLNQQAVKLGNKLPGTTADFHDMYRVLIEQGMRPKMILNGLGESAAYLGVQLRMPMASAAEFAAKMQDATRTPAKDMMGLMDIIQRTSNVGVESGNMLRGFSRLTPVLSIIKKEGLEASNVLAPLLAMADQEGIVGESAGNAYRKIFQRALDMKKMAKGNSVLAGAGIQLDFSDGKGEFAGLDNMFKQMQKLKKATTVERLAAIKEMFGDDAETIQAANIMIEKGKAGYDEMRNKMAQQASLRQRINAQLSTLSNVWEAATGTFTNAMVAMGETLAPQLKGLITWFGELSEGIISFTKEHPVLVGWILKTVAAIAAISVVIGGLLMTLAALFGPMVLFKYMLAMVSVKGGLAITVLKGIALAFRALMLANPVIAIITGLAIAGTLIYKNWAGIKEFFIGIFKSIATAFTRFVAPIMAVIDSVKGFMSGDSNMNLAVAGNMPAVKPTPMLKSGPKAVQHIDQSQKTIHVHPTKGMDETALAKMVGKEIEAADRKKASTNRSSFEDQH